MRYLFLLTFLCVLSAASRAEPDMLVSQTELAESQDAPAIFLPKAVPEKDAPRVEIVTPSVAARLKSPIQVQAAFVSTCRQRYAPTLSKFCMALSRSILPSAYSR